MKKLIASVTSFISLFMFAVTVSAATIVVVMGNTAAGENQPGWMFGRDITTSTAFEFNTDEASIGAGSLFVGPITNTNYGGVPGNNVNKDKFIAENFLAAVVSEVNSISFDYLIAGNGDSADSQQFYLNVYANIDNSTNFYDCRFDYVASGGSTTNFTTMQVDVTDTPTAVTKRGTRITSCPATLDQMPEGSYIRAFAINVGDTSANDTGLAGYLDSVVVDTDSEVVTYDFEPTLTPLTKDECKNGGWMTFNTPVFKNQGDCVSFVASGK